MGKVFNKDLYGKKVAVVCGSIKAKELADKLWDKDIATSDRRNDIHSASNAGKFKGRDYAISLDKGTYGKISVFEKKGYAIKKYNDCLVEKVEEPRLTPSRATAFAAPIAPASLGTGEIAISKDEYKQLVAKAAKSDFVTTAAVNTNNETIKKTKGDDKIMRTNTTTKGNGLFGGNMKDMMMMMAMGNMNGGNAMGGMNPMMMMAMMGKGSNGKGLDFKGMLTKTMGHIGFVDDISMTFSGQPAFYDQKRDRWLSYDVDQDILMDNFGLTANVKAFFAMPVVATAINPGDLIVTPMGGYAFVSKVKDGVIHAMTKASTKQRIKQVGNVLGLPQYVTKISPIFGGNVFGGNGSPMNPLMLMSFLGKDNDGGDMNMKDILMMQMFTQNGGTQQGINPMMLAMLGDDSDDGMMQQIMMFSMMSGQGANGTNPLGNMFGNMFGGAPATTAPAVDKVDPKDAEIAALKAEIASTPKVDPRDAEIAKLKAEVAKKRAGVTDGGDAKDNAQPDTEAK